MEDDDAIAFGEDAEEELPPPVARGPWCRSGASASGPTAGQDDCRGRLRRGAARTLGVLILTHRRLLVSQFDRELKAEGYGDRVVPPIENGQGVPPRPLTINTYAWFARHVDSISREAYQLVICDEAHTALGEKTAPRSAASASRSTSA